jgi:transposase-like protein
MKVRISEEYLAGKTSTWQLARENSIGQTTVRRWIGNYRSMGIEGLSAGSVNTKYSVETKQSAVEDYLSGRYSLSEIRDKYKIRSDNQLRKWVAKYNSHEDFKQPNSGGGIYMTIGRKTTREERIEIVCYCIANNKNYGIAIKQYGVSYHQIYAWVNKY